MIVDTNNVYACYGLYILFEAGTFLTRRYPEFVSTIKVAVIIEDNLDYCGHIDNRSHICKSYYAMIFEK